MKSMPRFYSTIEEAIWEAAKSGYVVVCGPDDDYAVMGRDEAENSEFAWTIDGITWTSPEL